MFDLETIDKLYEATKECGGLQFRIFDKQTLLPLQQIPDAVKGETGEEISIEELRLKAAGGWFPLLRGGNLEGEEEGSPMYAPSRVGLLLKLEREGYGPEELRQIAGLEEWAIDNMYAADDLAYIEDDLDTLVKFSEAQLEAYENADPADFDQVSKAQGELDLLRKLKASGVPEHLKPTIEKSAFRARAFNEGTRFFLMEPDRAKIRAGYSPWISFRNFSWGPEVGFSAGEIVWESTIRSALAYTEEGAAPTIRIPGWVLCGDQVVPNQTLRPLEYTVAWKEGDIDGYLKAWHQLHGNRCCLHCLTPLQPGNDRKRFCSERCRNAARQRRYRESNPEGVYRTQKRYWDSLPEDS